MHPLGPLLDLLFWLRGEVGGGRDGAVCSAPFAPHLLSVGYYSGTGRPLVQHGCAGTPGLGCDWGSTRITTPRQAWIEL
jgi:hypothetical protein